MSNLLDVRARVYCNLGPVISGNLQDTSAIGAGLVSTSGVVLLDGVYQVTPGDKIELAYYKEGRVARLGRSLRVISVYANPMTRTTELGVGCYLAYQAGHEPPPKVLSSRDDPNTPDLTPLESVLLLKPTSAKYLVEQICSAVGITHAEVPLTNVFYKEKFTLQGPYLQTLAALLVSEGFIGYMDSQEVLQFIDLKQTKATGPIFDESNLIDANPIQDTTQTADIVYSIVNHIKLKLDPAVGIEEPEVEPEPPNEGEEPPPLLPGDTYIYGRSLSAYVYTLFRGVESGPIIPPGGPGDDGVSVISRFLSAYTYLSTGGVNSTAPVLNPGDIGIYGESWSQSASFNDGTPTINGQRIGSDTGETIEDVSDRNNLDFDIVYGIIKDDKESDERTFPAYWTTSVTDNGIGELYFRYQESKNAPVQERTLYYPNISETRSRYNSDGQVTETVTKRRGPWGESRQISTVEYVNYPNYSVTIETVVEYVPAAEVLLACGIPSEALIPLPEYISPVAGSELYLKSRITTETTRVPGSQRSVTTGIAAMIYTTDGAQAIQTYIRSFTDINLGAIIDPNFVLRLAGNLRALPTRVEYTDNPRERAEAFSNSD